MIDIKCKKVLKECGKNISKKYHMNIQPTFWSSYIISICRGKMQVLENEKLVSKTFSDFEKY